MKFVGLYNFKGGGTEVITGNGSENTPSETDVLANDPSVFFSGQFTNLSRELIHVTIEVAGTSKMKLHKHDLRPYESLNAVNIPIASIAIHIGSTNKIGFHGMGVMWKTEDEDERAVFASKSGLFEGGSVAVTFNTDSYTRIEPTSATTQSIIESGDDDDFALFKITINTDAAGSCDLFWTDDSDSSIKYIGNYQFTAAGTYSETFPTWLRNPNRQGGKLRCTQTLANWKIDAIGHLVLAGQ